MLTEKQMEIIIMALAQGMKTFTEADAEQAIKWANNVLADYLMLSLVLEGRTALSVAPSGEMSLVGIDELPVVRRDSGKN